MRSRVVALAATALIAPVATWSTSRAQGGTPQTITFAALGDRTLDEAALIVTASASSGLPVTFSSTTPSVCSSTGTNGATISPSIPGVCTVKADQAGNGTFDAAPPVLQSFNVAKGSQTITFGVIPDRMLNQGPVVASANASTGFPVTFTTNTPSVCTASGTNGATITPIAVGTCTVQADQGGNPIFDPAPSVTQSFVVSKSSQAITFGVIANRTTLQSPFTVSASASSLLTVAFSTTTPAVCTSSGVNGTTITLLGQGTCNVQADQPGDTTFAAAPPAQRSFLVSRVAQSIVFDGISDKTAQQSPVTVSATASSGLPVTFSTTTPAVCTAGGVGGAQITLIATGSCTVQADQAGDAIFSPASPVAQSFAVTKSSQVITFATLGDRAVLQSPFALNAGASSGLAVTFSTPTSSVCTTGGVNGASVALVATGVCTIAADQAGNAVYSAAPTVFQSFTVTKADQSITFPAPANVPVGPPVTVSATASSGLDVTFSTTTPAVCAPGGAAGATITLLAAGACTVRADQAGDDTYNAAAPVLRTFGVGKIDQAISFPALAGVAVNHPPLVIGATASSGLTVMFSSVTPSICATSGTNGTTVTVLAAGTCTIAADQPGDTAYNAAPQVRRTFGVARAAQTITFAPLSDLVAKAFPTTRVVSGSATSRLAVTFTTTTPSVCKRGGTNGAAVKVLKAGTCTVRADQAGDSTYAAAAPVSRSFLVTAPGLPSARSGYWMLGGDGHVFAFGAAPDFGSAASSAVAFAARPDGTGYWVVDATGDVRAFGRATYLGGRPELQPGEQVSTMSSTPTGRGYWLFTTRGRAFAYGDAHFYGDMRAVTLNRPVIASVATPTGHGYYMVGSDGGVFSFGDARFHGSMGGSHLNRPIVGLSPTPDNRGYWLVASDGGVFAFDAPFRGSLGNLSLRRPVNGIVAYGNGYLMVASDGGVFDFSDKAFAGSLGDRALSAPIVGIAAFSGP
jgi:hypothetical protein